MIKKSLAALCCFTACLLPAADRVDGVSFAEFAENFDRVRQVAGLVVFQPAELSEKKRQEALAEADRILDGKLPFYNSEWIEVGETAVDWHGGQRDHQEWIAQLNRFRYLNMLADAWELTGDEKYARRARTLMEDFRRFVAEKNQFKFFDPQRNNPLNLSIRLENWSYALRRFGSSAAFDNQWVETILAFMTEQLKKLDEVTKPGRSNFQMYQSNTLVMTSLFLPNLPEASKRLKHGAEVMKECLALQFRSDGTHWENTCGYHTSMLRTALRFRKLSTAFPEISPGLDDDVIRKAIDFTFLSSPWALNDHALQPEFPAYAPMMKSVKSLIKDAGLTDWQEPRFRAFPEGGLFFAGNRDEHLVFDAAKVGSGHSHNSRLQLLYAAYGQIIIADSGIATYEKTSPFYVGGLHTMNHATVSPDHLAQLRTDAETLYYDLKPDYAILSGRYDAGYFRWEKAPSKTKGPDRNDLTHERTVIWLAGDYLLIFDRTRGPAETWNYAFPIPPQEKLVADQETASFRSENTGRPNFLIRMLKHPGSKLELNTYSGDTTGPVYRGFQGNLTGGDPRPVLEFSSAGTFTDSLAVTLIAASPKGTAVPEFKLKSSGHNWLEFENRQGGTDLWLWMEARMMVPSKTTPAAKVSLLGEQVLIRRNSTGAIERIFADRLTELKIEGKTILTSPGKPVSGYLDPEQFQ